MLVALSHSLLKSSAMSHKAKKMKLEESQKEQPSGDDQEKKLLPHGEPGTKHERTFIAIKPDGVQRGLVAPIIQRFEQKGFKLVGLKMLKPSMQMAEQHYSDLSKKGFFKGLCAYFSSGPIVAMVWEGHNVIATGRTLLGATKPDESAPGTIRGDFCIDVGRNICHGSDSAAAANKEINFWFKDSELSNWSSCAEKWVYE
eukprot:g72431.t1